MNNDTSQFRKISDDLIVFHNKNEIPYISVPHLHSQYEIYYNICGARGFMVNGKVYKCNNRDLIIVPKLQTHKVIVDKDTYYERCVINIKETVLEKLASICKNEDCVSWLKSESGTVNLNLIQHGCLMELVTSYNDETGDEFMKLSIFLRLMSFLRDAFSGKRSAELLDDGHVSYSDKVICLIEKNPGIATVAQIAHLLYINEDYINRVFKDETGITIKKYLIMRMLSEAKKHLYLGKSVKEACSLSGFGDYSNFLRTFKKYEGYTPGELEDLTKPI